MNIAINLLRTIDKVYLTGQFYSVSLNTIQLKHRRVVDICKILQNPKKHFLMDKVSDAFRNAGQWFHYCPIEKVSKFN